MKSMNLLRIYGATLLIALTAGMSACKNEEAPSDYAYDSRGSH